jgi:hypothetical protein
MFTTREVIELVRKANPEVHITEDRVRHAIRRTAVKAPARFGGRYAWSRQDIRRLTRCLGLTMPAIAAPALEQSR